MVKAVVVVEQGADPEVQDVVLPDVGPGDVRIRISGAGLCHSDLSMLNGTIPPKFPLVLGHEAAGAVAELGSAVTDLEIGDRVVINWAPACKECWFCRHGESWLCSNSAAVASVPRGALDDGTPVNAAMGIGAFAEETVLPRQALVRIPDGVPDDVASLLGCAVLTGVGAVRHTADVRAGDSAAVIGLGGVGLSAIAGARLVGASTIIAVDVHSEKEALARSMGATDFLLSHEKLAKEIRGLTGGRGVDHAFECVGAAATIRLAWESVRRGGQCVIVGAGRHTDTVQFNAMELFHFARRLTSSIYGSSQPERDIPDLSELIRGGRLDLSPLITHRTDLSGAPDALARMRAGQGARSLLQIS
jgi:S-(hydroxymethyl)glutathione dehydrogenase/alcohol dehydrogenase